MAYCLGNRELNSPYMSLETTYERIRRIVQMIGTGDVSPLAFALWLSRNRTEDGWFHAAAITGLILKPKAAARRCSAAMLR